MKRLLILPFLLSIISCSETTHPDADKICNCYRDLHRAFKETDVERIADSCNTIYLSIIEKYANDEEGKREFEEAYKNCQ